MKMSGYLPFSSAPRDGDRLVLSPAYVFPAELCERKSASLSRYFRRIILVDGYDGRSELTTIQWLTPAEAPVSGSELLRLPLRIGQDTARFLAEYGTVPCEYGRFITTVKDWKFYLRPEFPLLMWRVYSFRGDAFIDTFTGASVKSDKILKMSK